MTFWIFFALVVLAAVTYGWVRLRKGDQAPVSTLGPQRLKIEAFTCIGTSRSFTLSGRVSVDGGVLSSINAEFDRMNWARKLRRNLRRFLLPEMQGVPLEVRIGDVVRETLSGPHGVFEVLFSDKPELASGIYPYSVQLHEAETKYLAVKCVGQVIILSDHAPLGLITDIDDTIVESHIRNKIRMFFHAVFTTVSDLKPTPGFSALLNSLHMPTFYVSGSPQNLHDKINAFIRAHRFPLGPLYLTSIGFGRDARFFEQQIFKTERIRSIFVRYPSMKFVLVGDNTQVDSQIYDQIAREFPGRVRMILIYERVPKLQSKQIIPAGQHPIQNALDAALLLHEYGLISMKGLEQVVHEMILQEALPESFKLNRVLKKRASRYSTVTDLAKFRG